LPVATITIYISFNSSTGNGDEETREEKMAIPPKKSEEKMIREA
jgi:hypothetical protein